ncbi:alpha-glucosidase [Aerococcus sp. JJEM-2022b]|uniref:alpha-glucosidase n=1 Tax=Aerococcus mictus TaxID=2976810 RepID=UPI00227C4AD2|nr:alpha-glucosidase [Aerococcus mictus]MCY3077920.1 alpha-glucosidase [Aerococcus mictus]
MSEKNNEWWKNAVLYEIYPKSFNDSNNDGIGDLKGIQEKIPYLSDLGIDAIWLGPVYLSPHIDNGYDVSDYYQIDPKYGSNEDMYDLIEAAHQFNIKIIMDFVANHTSDQAYWFKESCKSADNKYSDFYIWQDAGPNQSLPNNWGSNFGGSAWTWNESRQQYYLHYYAKEMPDLNWENEEVRQAIYQAMQFWIDKGIDGWRLDVITSISKDWNFPNNAVNYSTSNQQNGPRMHEFLRELNRMILAPNKMMSVGEAPAAKASDATQLVDPKRQELDMVFTFQHMHIDRIKGNVNGRWAIKQPDYVELKEIICDWQDALRNKGWNALYFNNHDRARIVSRWGNDSKYRYESATAFATILHGLQGTPFIYQGEEIGMTNADFGLEDYVDVELKGNYDYFVKELQSISESDFLKAAHKVSRDHARTPMQWNNDTNAGFSIADPWFKVNPDYKHINVAADRKSKKSIFKYYKKLIQLRHEENILRDGDFNMFMMDDPYVILYERKIGDQHWIVAANLSENKRSIDRQLFDLDSYDYVIHNYENRKLDYELFPYESFIISYNIAEDE